MTERKLSVIFCDDVRFEINGKQTYVGCYSGEMLIKEFPVTLPKLSVRLIAQTEIAHPFKSLTLVVKTDKDVELGRAAFTEEDLAPGLKRFLNSPENDDSSLGVSVVMAFSPLAIDGPMKLQTRMITEEGEIKGDALRIRLATEDEAKNIQ